MPLARLIPTIISCCADLPQNNILDSTKATKKYGTNTFNEPTTVDLAIVVTQREQIGYILSLANKERFCICPLSSGNNWGYGSVNPGDGRPLVVLDLSKLQEIKSIDKESGLIALEPGVTQEQLANYLAEHDWDYMVPTTGTGPSCSVLSNAIERGYGPSPYFDHFSAVTSMRYFIAHSEHCRRENFSAIQSIDKRPTEEGVSLVDAAHKYGVGPYLGGLFTHSNMGIVTEISLRLGPKPEKFCSFFIKCKYEYDFEDAVRFTKQLLKEKAGELGIVNLMDKRRVCSMLSGNPNNKNQHINMSDAQINKIAKENKVAEWLIMGSIYATKDSVRATKKYIRSHAKFASEIMFSDSYIIKIGKWVTRYIMKDQRSQIEALQSGIDIMLGKPNQVALPLAYWRNPNVRVSRDRRLDPDNDGCGLLWYAPMVPMKGEKMKEFVNFIRSITPKYNIEPLITFTNLSYDYVDSTVPIIFNLNDPEAVRQAHKCVDELFDKGLEKGFVPYRLSTKAQNEKLDPEEPHWRVTNLIKNSLDPNGVINPARYNPK